MMQEVQFKVSSAREIDTATPIVQGYQARTIRLKLASGIEVGFATTTYGFSIPEELRAYGAARIGLALELLKGMTNDQVRSLLDEHSKKHDA